MTVTVEYLAERLQLADELRAGRPTMLEPQDLPGRYGRVVKAIDHRLRATGCESVLAGGWAVWRHGYVGRVTEDIDIVLPAGQLEDWLRTAVFAGFERLPQAPGRWPKLLHKETGVKVDILPEGARPGTVSRPAPTTIPHPARLGAAGPRLTYIHLPDLIELKLAAGRPRDEADVVELLCGAAVSLRTSIRRHLAAIHGDYVQSFDRLAARADEQQDE